MTHEYWMYTLSVCLVNPFHSPFLIRLSFGSPIISDLFKKYWYVLIDPLKVLKYHILPTLNKTHFIVLLDIFWILFKSLTFWIYGKLIVKTIFNKRTLTNSGTIRQSWKLSGSTKETARPTFPTRPVRPTRWIYTTRSSGNS